MSSKTKAHVVKVTGVPDDLLHMLDARVGKRRSGGRSKYVRDLIRRDLLGSVEDRDPQSNGRPTVADAEAIFRRIESRATSHIQPLAPGADSRETIYGDRV